MSRAPVSETLTDLKATRASIAALEQKKRTILDAYRATGDKRWELKAWLLDESIRDLRGTLERNERAVAKETR